MPATGSCLCGAFSYSYTGEPHTTIACYCKPCRKSSGNTHSVNLLIPDDQFKVESGNVLNYSRAGDSGKNVKYSACATCGGLLFVEAEAFTGTKIVKIGTVDQAEVIQAKKPEREIYTANRFEWCPQYPGAAQAEGGS